MSREGKIPVVEIYKHVGLHDGQGPARLAVVRNEIDRVIELSALVRLVEWAKDIAHAPESRSLAGAKALAIVSGYGNARQKRPQGITAEYIQAVVAGLNSEGWRSPTHFGTLIEAGPGAVKREIPLEE
jgi:hypothetical protein